MCLKSLIMCVKLSRAQCGESHTGEIRKIRISVCKPELVGRVYLI